jgi:hypothetical protein
MLLMKTKRYLGLLGVVLVAALQAIGLTSKQAQGATPAAGHSSERAEVPFQVLIRDADMTAWQPFRQMKQEVYLPLTNEQSLSTNLGLNSLDPASQPFPPKELKQINFDKEIGFYLTRGIKGRGGYTLEVTRLEKEGQTVYVRVHLQDPQGMADSAMHYRVTLLKMEKADLPSGDVKYVVTDQSGNVLTTQERTN